MNTNKILLPGLDKQFQFLRKHLTSKVGSVLVIGSASEKVAERIEREYSCKVELIVEDYESLMSSKIILGNKSSVNISMMNFEVTDFNSTSFDFVYAQASISLTKRNKIVKEIKRILRPNGFFCVGEVVSLKSEYPQFVKDIFNSSDLLPLFIDDLEKYYNERQFNVLAKGDFSSTLQEYYSQSSTLLKDTKENLTDQEKSYYKKLLNRISHESNAYLKLGGNKHIGFAALLLQKGS